MKKKLIAIVTSLAMVATMVPATAAAATTTSAAPKAIAGAKDTTSQKLFVQTVNSMVGADKVTETNALEESSKCSRARGYLAAMTAAEKQMPESVAARETMQKEIDKIKEICIPLMEKYINAKARPGQIGPRETFEDIVAQETILTRVGMQPLEIQDSVKNYAKYEKAQLVPGLALKIQQNENGLTTKSDYDTLKAAITAVRGSDPYIDTETDEVRSWASNYKTFSDAVDQLESLENGEALIRTYAGRINTATANLSDLEMANTRTAGPPEVNPTTGRTASWIQARIQEAEALLTEANQNWTLDKALETYKNDYIVVGSAPGAPVGSLEAVGYTAMKAGLKTQIDNAATVLEHKRIAQIFKNKVEALPAANDIELKNLAAAQEVYEMMDEATGTVNLTAANALTNLNQNDWGIEVDNETVKTACEKLKALADKITATIGTATKADFTKAVISSFANALPSRDGVTVDHKYLLDGVKTVCDVDGAGADAGAGELALGVDVSSKLDVADAGVTTEWTAFKADFANRVTKLTGVTGDETSAATDFIKTVITDLNGMTGKEADYEIELNKALKAYNALADMYKRGGTNYNATTTVTIGGNNYTVQNAYDTDKVADTAPYSLKTLIDKHELEKANAARDAIFSELVNGISKLPATVTIADKDTVYALRDKRDTLTAEQKEVFEDTYKDYNKKLDAAIKAVDAAVVAELDKQIGELTIIDAKATPEEIQKAKAANKAARDEYEKLTDTQKAVVTNYPNLQAAEVAVEAAEVQYAKDQMAAVIKDIDLNALTEEQAKAILAVNDMINALNGAQKTEVEKDSNYAAFQEAVKAANGGKPIDPIEQPKDLAKDASVAAIANQTYNGKAKTPAVSVTAGGKALVQGTDYTATYKNNTNIGRATVTITGAGDYTGTITKTFIITPAKGTVTKVTAGKKKVTVSYKTQKSYDGKTGYRIICKAKGLKAIGVNTTAAGKKTVSKLKSGKTYQVKVRAYKTIGGHKYWGSYSAVKKVKVK